MEIKKAIKSLDLKFTSGNDIPVTRATILIDEWEALKEYIIELEEIKWIYNDLRK